MEIRRILSKKWRNEQLFVSSWGVFVAIREFFFNFSYKSCVTSFFYRQLFFIVRWKDRKVGKFEAWKKVDLIWLKRKTFVFVLRFFNLGKLGSDFGEDTNSPICKQRRSSQAKRCNARFANAFLTDVTLSLPVPVPFSLSWCPFCLTI